MRSPILREPRWFGGGAGYCPPVREAFSQCVYMLIPAKQPFSRNHGPLTGSVLPGCAPVSSGRRTLARQVRAIPSVLGYADEWPTDGEHSPTWLFLGSQGDPGLATEVYAANNVLGGCCVHGV